MNHNTYTIDAANKVLGRLAVEISRLLQGKNQPDFAPNKDIGNIVIVENVAQVKITGKKMEQKKYYHYSGYPGGLKEKPLEVLLKEKPSEVLKKAVYGMLPKNKLRARQIKRLKFE